MERENKIKTGHAEIANFEFFQPLGFTLFHASWTTNEF